MQSITDRVIEALLRRGSREVPSPSRKYRCFTRDVNETGSFYFVGRCGALRAGKTVTGSVSLSNGFRQRLLAGDAASV